MDFLRGFAAFLSYKYWLNPNPVPLGPSLVMGILSFFGWFILLAVVLLVVAKYMRKRDKLRAEILSRFAWPLLASGLMGLLTLFMSYEQIPYLGMRLWFLVTFIYLLAKISALVVYVVRVYPNRRRERDDRARKQKWLTKKK